MLPADKDEQGEKGIQHGERTGARLIEMVESIRGFDALRRVWKGRGECRVRRVLWMQSLRLLSISCLVS
jgi:hypothetical protein